MRNFIFTLLLIMAASCQLVAQRTCTSFDYEQQKFKDDPSLKDKITGIENFIQRKSTSASKIAGKPHEGTVITIPVVVHILYNKSQENISDEKVISQIDVLNKSFRRLSADTVNTPEWFKGIAADCGIEFKLAVSDPERRSTTGIVRKYTPVTKWEIDDQMKSSARTGDDPWDTQNYLNIWVCNLDRVAGYSSFPGGPEAKDGIVIAYNVFGKNSKVGYEQGKTAVHEAGHWLGLRHIWGDGYCGDDWVDDTPKQGNFTPGCPTGIRQSCSSGSKGDMYMNYMDLTLDACINLFTEGQKERMRTLFEKGGARYTMTSSYALLPATNNEPRPAEELPGLSEHRMYPNPATSELILDLSYDIRWIGQPIRVTNMQGQPVMQLSANSTIVKLDISKLKPGLYFLMTKKDDGATIKQKFIKM
ncbi:MAG TPA: M43 family zinc metalloprotease [Chitinophagaceae bacterium]|nr:M43 family zinc metalloprotease [Chitinophagaceae bacterium]